jgi:hypothetical protein
MSGFTVDHHILGAVARELRSGRDTLEKLAGSVPGVPDAGAVTGAVAAALAHVIGATGAYSTGLALAGDAVHEGRRGYLALDHTGARTFSHIF